MQRRYGRAGCDLCDGMIVDYAERQEQIEPAHYFAEDIISYARTVAARYESNKEHTENVEKTALAYLTASKREQDWISATAFFCRWPVFFMTAASMSICLVVQITAAILFRATEFVGLSEQEKSIIADTIKYNAWHYVPKLSELKAPLNRKKLYSHAEDGCHSETGKWYGQKSQTEDPKSHNNFQRKGTDHPCRYDL